MTSASMPRAIDAAFRLYMLPQGMFSVAVATVLAATDLDAGQALDGIEECARTRLLLDDVAPGVDPQFPGAAPLPHKSGHATPFADPRIGKRVAKCRLRRNHRRPDRL